MIPTFFVALLTLAAVGASANAIPRDSPKPFDGAVDIFVNRTRIATCSGVPSFASVVDATDDGCMSKSIDGKTCHVVSDTCPVVQKACKSFGGYYDYAKSNCQRTWEGRVGLRMGDRQFGECSDVAHPDAVRKSVDDGCIQKDVGEIGATCWLNDTKCETFRRACTSFGGQFQPGRCSP
ncbi:hypothetical protein HGRIS_014046 [Hohenbuehelia grisea]|uniref:Uncharacterized protein n=1 Tax=Hohenbuehelia grisea TaxID=104357 RepID=A0ABR3JT04_9AGAR